MADVKANGMKHYFAIIHKDKDSAYGVVFPDLPGCYAAGDTYDQAIRNAGEALRLYAEAEASAGRKLPEPRDFATLYADHHIREEAAEAPFVSVPLLADAGRTVRVNVTLDAALLEAIDEAARQRGLTRSGFLAQAAREKITS
jgi:predicted RNase H-like HicB family nuclease